jgi:hypothetical protein
VRAHHRTVVLGMAAMLAAIAEAGMTIEQNLAALAGKSHATMVASGSAGYAIAGGRWPPSHEPPLG